ncbi:MAG: hypothetical protein ACO1PB_07610 [Ramlibacter sp.]
MTGTAGDLQRENPFDLTKASDYSDAQVQEYWVDVDDANKSLVTFIKPTSLVPMFLLGGKGSGKTHLMRYCSSAVQELRCSGLRTAIAQERYLGVYTSADGLNVHRFSGKGQSEETWESVFAYSFELWLASSLLTSLRPALIEQELASPEWNDSLVANVLALFHIKPSVAPTDFDALIRYLGELRAGVDVAVNNSAISRKLSGITVSFNPGDLVFGMPSILAQICTSLQKTVFVYLIDEVENFTEQQQRFLNTLVRYRKGNVTLRIGARLYGLKTESTLGSGEPIKRDAEYERLELDARLREEASQYESLAARLVLKRLQKAHTGAGVSEVSLPSAFAELSAEKFHQRISLEIVSTRDGVGTERPHIARFRDAATSVIRDKQLVEQLVEALRVPEHPLLEKVNLLAFYKRVARGTNVLSLARNIEKESAALLQSGASAAPEYHDLYSHFSSDLLAQLYRDYGRKPVYAGFKTLVRLSQGVPRNLLSLLKHIYRRSSFAGEEPFVRGQISVDAQVQGIYDTSEWFWEDAQPDEHGSLVRNAVEQLATLARSIRYSDSPSECDLCCYLINRDTLDNVSGRALRMAENWSFLLRVKGISGAKNDDRLSTKYQINPMLAARWGISEARRGAIELKRELALTLLSGSDPSVAQQAITNRTEAMYLPKLLEINLALGDDDKQTSLFDGE